MVKFNVYTYSRTGVRNIIFGLQVTTVEMSDLILLTGK